jgi:hypothetical protein
MFQISVTLVEIHFPFFLFKHHDGWLQGKVAHFLHCNLVFCRVACIYMLSTWHKNNNFSNLWLDLNFELEKENIYKNNCNIHTPNL